MSGRIIIGCAILWTGVFVLMVVLCCLLQVLDRPGGQENLGEV